jgi:uncharacterized protein
MKYWIGPIGGTLGLLLAAAVLLHGQGRAEPAADTKKDKRTLHTAGTATIKIKPDAARVFFGVQTIAKTVKAAREENGLKVKKVMDALVDLKIADLKMKTTNLSVELVQSQEPVVKLPEILGYRVTHTLSVLVSDQNSVKLSSTAARVLDTALENGANVVQQIVVFKQDEAETKRQALSKAVEEALANAKAIAAGAKVQVLDTISIDGPPEYSYGMGQCGLTNSAVVPEAGGGDTPVAVGDLEITCRVSVTCSY